jgi:hypothetical protein
MTNRYNQAQNFVAPAVIEARPTVAELLPPEPATLGAFQVTPAAQTIIQQKDTELSRAQATTIFSLPLAIGLGVVTTAAVLTLTSTPILSAVTLIVFFVTFAGVWLGAFVYHVSRSPAGSSYMHTRRMWDVIEREQQHRHAAYWHAIDRQETRRHDNR